MIITITDRSNISKKIIGDKISTARVDVYKVYYTFETVDFSYCYYVEKPLKFLSKNDWFNKLSPLDKEEFIWNLDFFSKLEDPKI